MNVLSLFDGISCGHIALERAGIKVDNYYASEIEKQVIEIAKKNYPNTIFLGDVRNVDGTKIPNIDIVIFGSPCTNLSFSGKRQGLSTAEKIEVTDLDTYLRLKSEGVEFSGQSYLFWEAVRILNEIKPKYFLCENVRMEERWKNVFTKALGVEPIRINSNLVSAQNRDRYYWTNIPNVSLPEDRGILLKDILRDEDKIFYHLSEQHYEAFLKSYPNWKDSPIDGKSKPILASYYKQPPHCPYIKEETSKSGYRMLSPVECERLQTLPDNYTEGFSKCARYKAIGNGWTVDVIAHILKFIN